MQTLQHSSAPQNDNGLESIIIEVPSADRHCTLGRQLTARILL